MKLFKSFTACRSTTTGTENGHEYVDLGLPSGTKWATCNVGATAPEAYGDCFAWGETEPKDYYDWNTYKFTTDGCRTFTKYNDTDGKTTLDPEDDAAAVNWGGRWRMPTDAEWIELEENCTWTWTRLNGVNGCEVKSKTNGNSIFLPEADRCDFGGVHGIHFFGDSGGIFTRSLLADNPNVELELFADLGNDEWFGLFGGNYDRYYGSSVRPVFK